MGMAVTRLDSFAEFDRAQAPPHSLLVFEVIGYELGQSRKFSQLLTTYHNAVLYVKYTRF